MWNNGVFIESQPVRAMHFGLDLGQSQDYSAIAGIEHETRIVARNADRSPKLETHCNLVYLERIPLGTPYPEVVERVEDLVKSPGLASQKVRLIVDASGVGAPVFDLLEQAKLGIPVMPVVITPGEDMRQSGKRLLIPKKDLVANLQLHLQQDRLHIAAGVAGLDLLLRELREFRMKATAKGHERYTGPHDDLVLAASLAAWPQSGKTYGEQSRRLL